MRAASQAYSSSTRASILYPWIASQGCDGLERGVKAGEEAVRRGSLQSWLVFVPGAAL